MKKMGFIQNTKGGTQNLLCVVSYVASRCTGAFAGLTGWSFMKSLAHTFEIICITTFNEDSHK